MGVWTDTIRYLLIPEVKCWWLYMKSLQRKLKFKRKKIIQFPCIYLCIYIFFQFFMTLKIVTSLDILWTFGMLVFEYASYYNVLDLEVILFKWFCVTVHKYKPMYLKGSKMYIYQRKNVKEVGEKIKWPLFCCLCSMGLWNFLIAAVFCPGGRTGCSLGECTLTY